MRKFVLIAVFSLIPALSSVSHSADSWTAWNCDHSASWTTDTCWNGNTQPVNGEDVYISERDFGSYTVTYDTNAAIALDTLIVGRPNSKNPDDNEISLNITAPFADIDANSIKLGYGSFDEATGITYSGSGAILQEGGMVGTLDGYGTSLYLGTNLGDSGRYTLTGGNFFAGFASIGDLGSGEFNHDGASGSGVTSYIDELFLGYYNEADGVYNLGAGTLISNYQYIGLYGEGTFNQTTFLNSNNQTGSLYMGYGSTGSGEYNMYGGWIMAVDEQIGSGGTGTFTQWDGLNSISGNLILGYLHSATGTYAMLDVLGGNPVLEAQNEIVGSEGDGVFTQIGGSNSMTGNLVIGDREFSSGSYTLDSPSGVLSASNEYVGKDGSGSFTQYNGSNNVLNTLSIGEGSSGTGTYELNGGFLAASSEQIGVDGVGTFNHNGGFNFVTEGLSLGVGTGRGEYNLNGGFLSARSENIGSETGLGTFNQTGGNNNVMDTLSISSNSEYNLMGNAGFGGQASLSAGNIINDGTFNYSGGMLSTFGNICTYCGDPNPATFAFTNNSTFNVSGGGDTKFVNGDFVNNGRVKVTDSTVEFNGTFTNNGEYNSDPSSSYFDRLIIGMDGYLTGGIGDKWFISLDLINNSTKTDLWFTEDSYLAFFGFDMHEFFLPGWDEASSESFSWDTLELIDGGSLLLNGNAGAALYVENLILSFGSSLDLNGFDLYYANLIDLGGTISGGRLIDTDGTNPVPEPSTYILLAAGFASLIAYRKFYADRTVKSS